MLFVVRKKNKIQSAHLHTSGYLRHYITAGRLYKPHQVCNKDPGTIAAFPQSRPPSPTVPATILKTHFPLFPDKFMVALSTTVETLFFFLESFL